MAHIYDSHGQRVTDAQVRSGASLAHAASREAAFAEFQQRAMSLTEAFQRRFVTGQDLPASTGKALQNPLSQHITVFRCINLIAGNASRIPLELYWGDRTALTTQGYRNHGWLTRSVQKRDAVNVRANHPLVHLFRKPNPSQGWPKFCYTIVAHLLTRGNFYVMKEFFLTREGIASLYPLRPDRVEVQVDDSNYFVVKAWRIAGGKGGSKTPLDPTQIMHGEYAPDPDDPHKGISPLGVARLTVEQDHNAAVYNDTMLRRGGQPGALLRYKGLGKLDDEQRNELAGEWENKFSGPDAAARIAVINGDFDFSSIAVSPKDMQFLAARNFNLDEIARVYDVPKLYLNANSGTGGLGDAGLRVEERRFYRSNLIPLLESLGRLITEEICNEIDPEVTAVFNFDGVEALSEDLEAKGRVAKTFYDMGVPLNDIIEKLDLPFDPVDGGEEGLVASGLTTRTALIDQANAPPPPSPFGGFPGAAAPGGDPGAYGLPDRTGGAVPALPAPGFDGSPPGGGEQRSLGKALAPMRPASATERDAGGQAGNASEAEWIRATLLVRSARHRDWWTSHRRVFDALESKGIQRCRKALKRERDRIIGKLRQVPHLRARGLPLQLRAKVKPLNSLESIDLPGNWSDVQDSFADLDVNVVRRAIEPVILDSVKVGIGSTAGQLYDIGVTDEATMQAASERTPKIVSNFLDARGPYLVKIGDDLRELVGHNLFHGKTEPILDEDGNVSGENVLIPGWKQGGSLRDLMNIVKDAFDEEASFQRTRNIARTEVGIAMAQGRMNEARGTGATHKQWLTAGDEHVRDEHVRAGEMGWIPIDEPFDLLDRKGNPAPMDGPGDDGAPAELVINCRCGLIFKAEQDESILSEIDAALAEDEDGQVRSFDPVLRYNENHDEDGKFATGSSSGGAKGAKPTRQALAKQALEKQTKALADAEPVELGDVVKMSWQEDPREVPTYYAGTEGSKAGPTPMGTLPCGDVVKDSEGKLQILPRDATAAAAIGWMKDQGIEFQGMVDQAESLFTSPEAEGSERWYHDAQKEIHDLALKYDLTDEQATAVVAVLSPRNTWEDKVVKDFGHGPVEQTIRPNIRDAKQMMAIIANDLPVKVTPEIAQYLMTYTKQKAAGAELQGRTDLTTYKDGYYMGRTIRPSDFANDPDEFSKVYPFCPKAVYGMVPVRSAYTILTGNKSIDDVLTIDAYKVRSFYSNLVNPDGSTASTVDTHMIRALTNRTDLLSNGPKGTPVEKLAGTYVNNKQKYSMFDAAIRYTASKHGVKPSEVQAKVWSVWKARNSRLDLLSDRRDDRKALASKKPARTKAKAKR